MKYCIFVKNRHSQPRLYNRTDKAVYLIKESSVDKAIKASHKAFVGQKLSFQRTEDNWQIPDSILAPHWFTELRRDYLHQCWQFIGTDGKNYTIKDDEEW